MRYTYILILIFITLSQLGCDDFLDESPNKTKDVEPQTVEHLDALISGRTKTIRNPTVLYASDDYGLFPELYDAIKYRAYCIPTAYIFYTLFDKEVAKGGFAWGYDFKNIFTANMVLFYLDKVDGDKEWKKRLRAEAHFMKAVSYMDMVSTYCMPYSEETKDELGLPIKNSVSFEEGISRASLEETMEYIKIQLDEALEVDIPMSSNSNGLNKTWRLNTPAVYAQYSRYWLMKHDYDKALDYANKALSGHNELMDYNIEVEYEANPTTLHITHKDGTTEDFVLKYSNFGKGERHMSEWKEAYYDMYYDDGNWANWEIPSMELMDLYDKDNDLRYRYNFVDGYSYDFWGGAQSDFKYSAYAPFPGSGSFRLFATPTVAEMILTKAECMARLGDWQNSLEGVNNLRSKRFITTADPSIVNLSATSQDDAILKILEERRRELAFSTRMFDIRRFNFNDYPNDDVILSRTFYPISETGVDRNSDPILYKLSVKDRRLMDLIPENDILSSDGQIKQNTY